jgi:hypothetical protein
MKKSFLQNVCKLLLRRDISEDILKVEELL